MSYESYMAVCYACAAISSLFLVISIVLFFKLKILSVIGDLSGSTARKAINDIRERNALSGNKAYKPSAVNRERGKITDRITQTGSVPNETDEIMRVNVGTEKISASCENETTVLASETTVLPSSSADGSSWVEIEEDIVFTHTDEKIN